MLKQRLNRHEIYSKPAYWDEKASIYDQSAVSMWPNKELNTLYNKEQMEMLRQMLPDVRGKKLLDMGCGTGRLSRHLADMGAEVTGLDFSAKSIALADAENNGRTFLRYICQSVFDLNGEQTWDGIFTCCSITLACRNADETRDVLARCRRSLHSRGWCLFLEPLHRGPLHRVLRMGKSDFLTQMETAGFRIESVKQMHYWPARVFLAYVSWPKFLTKISFSLGQVIMNQTGCGGDYSVILAYTKD